MSKKPLNISEEAAVQMPMKTVASLIVIVTVMEKCTVITLIMIFAPVIIALVKIKEHIKHIKNGLMICLMKIMVDL